jgi:hypothetical protein
MNPAAQRAPLIAALEQLAPHDHLCSIYDSPQEHYAVAIPFIRIGLDRGEKCIYIADDGTVGDVRQAMQSEGIDVERAIASKALVLATKEQAYLEHGSFDPDWMLPSGRKPRIGDERRVLCAPRHRRNRMGSERGPRA